MSRPSSVPRLVFTAVLALLFILASLFVPAGSLDWPEGWLFAAVLFADVLLAGSWLKKHSPGLIEKRVSLKVPVKGWDKILMLFLGIFVVALLAVAGLDAVRFKLTEMPLALEAVGFVGFAIGLYLNFLAMKENAFARSAFFPSSLLAKGWRKAFFPKAFFHQKERLAGKAKGCGNRALCGNKASYVRRFSADVFLLAACPGLIVCLHSGHNFCASFG